MIAHLHFWFHFLVQIGLRVVDVLPEASNAVLIFIGIVISVPTYVDWVDKHPVFRRRFAGVCLIIAAGGGYVSIRQRHEATDEMKNLVTNTNDQIDKTVGREYGQGGP